MTDSEIFEYIYDFYFAEYHYPDPIGGWISNKNSKTHKLYCVIYEHWYTKDKIIERYEYDCASGLASMVHKWPVEVDLKNIV